MLQVIVAAIAILSLAGCSALVSCGFERWPVKDALDRDAGQINLTPQDSTIAALIALPAPPAPQARYDTRYPPIETVVYRVWGDLKRVSFSADDGDYHLIVADGAGRTMVVEAPDPGCAQGSFLIRQIGEVRRQIEVRFHSFPVNPGIRVRVTGVGFFDRIHDVVGQAPNGIELHPIVEIEMARSNGSASRHRYI